MTKYRVIIAYVHETITKNLRLIDDETFADYMSAIEHIAEHRIQTMRKDQNSNRGIAYAIYKWNLDNGVSQELEEVLSPWLDKQWGLIAQCDLSWATNHPRIAWMRKHFKSTIYHDVPYEWAE